MYPLPKIIQELTRTFATLPGVGKRTAQRLVQDLLVRPAHESVAFGELLSRLHEDVHFCEQCFALTEKDQNLCPVCSDPKRDARVLCVVEHFLDVVAIEETGVFGGVYHVLKGVLSPLDGVGPDKLTLDSLFMRLGSGAFDELVIATNPTMEGEATALFIKNHLKNTSVRISRIAKGMPMGGSIDYADGMTLGNALEQRVIY